MAAQAVDQLVAQMVEVDRAVGDLAQGDDRVLVVVAVDRQLRAGRDVAGALRRQHDQLETAGHAQDAVFDGDAGH